MIKILNNTILKCVFLHSVPLLDQPLEVAGSRERKKVARLEYNTAGKDEKKPFEVPQGNGTKLGDIPRIEHFISVSHKLMF